MPQSDTPLAWWVKVDDEERPIEEDLFTDEADAEAYAAKNRAAYPSSTYVVVPLAAPRTEGAGAEPVAFRSKEYADDPAWELTPYRPLASGLIIEPLYASPTLPGDVVVVPRAAVNDEHENLLVTSANDTGGVTREAIEDMRAAWRHNPAMPTYQRLLLDGIFDLALSAIEPPKPVAGLDERAMLMAEAMWRAETADMPAAHRARTSQVWREQSATTLNKWLHLARAALSALPASQDGEKAVLPCDVHLPPATILRKGVSLSALLAGLKARGMNLPDPPPTPEAGKYADGVRAAAKIAREHSESRKHMPGGHAAYGYSIAEAIEALLQPDSKDAANGP